MATKIYQSFPGKYVLEKAHKENIYGPIILIFTFHYI